MRISLILLCLAACFRSLSAAENPFLPKPPAVKQPVAETPPPAPKTTVSLQASGIGAGKNTERLWRTSWGSYEKAFERTWNIQIHVRAWGKSEATAAPMKLVLETLWFGRTLDSSKTRILVARHKRQIELKPGALSEPFFDSSGIVQGNVLYLSSLRSKYTEGAKLEGWYTRVVDADGKMLADAAGASYFTDLCRDPKKLALVPDASGDARSAR